MKHIDMRILVLGFCICSIALAQPFQWPENYAATSRPDGIINTSLASDLTSFNLIVPADSVIETLVLDNIGGPTILYRDWAGNKRLQQDNGVWNMFWAQNIEEVTPYQEYIVTLREGWRWSDGEIMDVDDIIATHTLQSDSEVASENYDCSVIDEEPVQIDKISQYQYRIKLPKPIVSLLARTDCRIIPEHIYMPVYEAEGAQGVKALWGLDSDVTTIVSGGPYTIQEILPGERLVLERNPFYGQQVKAADGSALPGAEEFIIHFVEDTNAELSLVITGRLDYYYPADIDQLASINAAIRNGSIAGKLYANLGPSTLVDMISYNFNNEDSCKSSMFRDVRFRQAMSLLINRQELVETALGGAGIAARGILTSASLPFGSEFLGDFAFDPEAGLELLAAMGFTDLNDDGILINRDTGCLVDFTLQYNNGNTRRSQSAIFIAQSLRPYGIKITPLGVVSEVWIESIAGNRDYDVTGKRSVDYDAQIWALGAPDVDSPSQAAALTLQGNANAWNKSKVDIAPWELQLDSLTKQIDRTFDFDKRVEVYRQRAELMREYLPFTPLIAPNFHFYTGLSNNWAEEALDATSIDLPYRPGNFISLLMK